MKDHFTKVAGKWNCKSGVITHPAGIFMFSNWVFCKTLNLWQHGFDRTSLQPEPVRMQQWDQFCPESCLCAGMKSFTTIDLIVKLAMFTRGSLEGVSGKMEVPQGPSHKLDTIDWDLISNVRYGLGPLQSQYGIAVSSSIYFVEYILNFLSRQHWYLLFNK